MGKFTAEDARKLTDDHEDKISKVIDEIESAARMKSSKAFIYEPLPSGVVQEVEDRGFKVKAQPSISQQMDDLHYIIEW